MCQAGPSDKTESKASALSTREIVIAELAWVLPLGIQQVASKLCMFGPRLLVMGMVGRLEGGPLLLSGVGMGSMYNNVFGQSVILATSFGATSLLSQAFGAGNLPLVGVVLQRMILFHFLILVVMIMPLSLWVEDILLAVGQPSNVSHLVKRFVLLRLPAIPFVILQQDLNAYLAAQGIARTPMVCNMIGALVTLLVAMCLIRDDALGYDGAALSLTVGEAAIGLVLLFAAPNALPKRGRSSTWPRWNLRDAASGWGEMLLLAAPSTVVVMSEWTGWEISVLMAGWLCPSPSSDGAQNGASAAGNTLAAGNASTADASTAAASAAAASAAAASTAAECTALESFPILSQTMVVFFLLHFGFSIACGNRVGNLLGEGAPRRARICALATLAFALALALCLCVVLVSMRWHWASFFLGPATTDAAREVRSQVAAVLPIVAVYIFLDTIGPAWAHQILFGIGGTALRIPAVNNFTTFFCCGLLVGHTLAFDAGWGLAGLWCGLVVGMAAMDGGLLAYVLGVVDWRAIADAARLRVLEGPAAGGQPAEPDGSLTGLASSTRGALASSDSAALEHVTEHGGAEMT